MPVLFAAALFLSAALVFWVQPMAAKLVLHLLGGTPAVWNTCMVFFQVTLLAGYAYAHALSGRLALRRQALVHVVVLALPVVVLPITVPQAAVRSLPQAGSPVTWLIGLLIAAVGLPFFALATTAPLVQRWFAATGHARASDPYFLYGSSNLGGLVGLVSYPLLIGPALRLTEQSRLWTWGYAVFAALMGLIVLVVWRAGGANGHAVLDQPGRPPEETEAPVGLLRRARWVALAAVPSSLMLGVTTYITADVASIPLLWVIPLGIYLLSFIVAFARRPVVPHAWVARAVPVVVAALAYRLFFEPEEVIWIPLHLLAFAVLALYCHGELARDRPAAGRLTEFYLCLALGGALGGMLNGLVAPLVFNRVAEYPLAIVLACLLRVETGDRCSTATPSHLRSWLGNLAAAALAGLAAGALARGVLGPYAAFGSTTMKLAVGMLAVGCYACEDRPLRFALMVGALMAASGLAPGVHGRVLVRERNFFGTLRVTVDPTGSFRQLIHGGTLHGRQSLDPAAQDEPLSYYGRQGPIGQVFAAEQARRAALRVAVVGLGAGALASYGRPGDAFAFYEIDPAVVRIARDPRYFTYLRDTRAGSVQTLVGDARLRLQEAPERAYNLIVLDAFSSDAVPVHLLTREAQRLYLARLDAGGLIAIHISSNYLDFKPLLAAQARDANLAARACDDLALSGDDLGRGLAMSQWVVLARTEADLGALAHDQRWQLLPDRPAVRPWTDDYCDIIAVFKARPF